MRYSFETCGEHIRETLADRLLFHTCASDTSDTMEQLQQVPRLSKQVCTALASVLVSSSQQQCLKAFEVQAIRVTACLVSIGRTHML